MNIWLAFAALALLGVWLARRLSRPVLALLCAPMLVAALVVSLSASTGDAGKVSLFSPTQQVSLFAQGLARDLSGSLWIVPLSVMLAALALGAMSRLSAAAQARNRTGAR